MTHIMHGIIKGTKYDTFTEQAVDKQLYALQEQIDELRRMSTANKILATANKKTQDLLSKRLDKVMEVIKCD